MEKNIFTKPKIEIVTIDFDDIITASPGIELPDDEWQIEE